MTTDKIWATITPPLPAALVTSNAPFRAAVNPPTIAKDRRVASNDATVEQAKIGLTPAATVQFVTITKSSSLRNSA
jgi:hypothetical protein